MRKPKRFLFLLALVLAVTVSAGCAENRTPAEILQEGLKKNGEIQSAAYSGTIQLNLELPRELFSRLPPDALIFYELLKNAKIDVRGSFRKEPFLAEIILTTDVRLGDLQTSISLPLLLNESRLWVKVPELPETPELASLTGKFVQFEAADLSSLTGREIPPVTDWQLQQRLFQELSELLCKHFDDAYFSKLDVQSLDLPEQLEAKHAVRFRITRENFGPFLMTLLDKVAPEAIDIMSKPEYQALTHMTPERAGRAKAAIAETRDELEKKMAELDNTVQITQGSLIFVLDKQDYIRRQSAELGLTVTLPDLPGPVKVGLKMVQTADKINQPPTFENAIPPAEGDVIPFADLFNLLANP